MPKQYLQDNLNEGFRITTVMPIDDRSVVQSVSDLFNWGNATFGEYIYSGMPVAVIKNNSLWNDPDNGIYYLTRQGKIQYMYDSSVSEETPSQPNETPPVPGISNQGGWVKLVSFNDLGFPKTDGDYVLTINQGGVTWTPYDPSSGGTELPTPYLLGKYLKVVPGPSYAQDNTDLVLSWEDVPASNIPDPQTAGNFVLQVLDPTDPRTWSWVEEDTGRGITVKGYPGQGDHPDQDGRWHPGSDNVQKNTMSNSGEVIAVPVDSTEDNSEEGPNRPFKLMLDYDKIPPLTIYGGNSQPDAASYTFTSQFYLSTDLNNPVFSIPQTVAGGDPIPSQRQPGSVVYNGQDGYTVGNYFYPQIYPTGTMSDNVVVKYEVTALPSWNPVVKYAIQPSFTNYDWTAKGTSSSPTELVETAPQGTTTEIAGANAKYFYAPSGTIRVMQVNTVTCRLRIEDSANTSDLARVDMWDQTNGQWIELTQNTTVHLTRTQNTVPPTVSEWDMLAQVSGTDLYTPVELTLRFKITKQ